MNVRIFIIHFILAILLLVPALIYNHKYNSVNYKFTDEPTYRFNLDINPHNEFSIYPLLIIYNFENNQGNITFKVTDGVIPNYFGIIVPTHLNVTNIEFINRNGSRLIVGSDYHRENTTYDTTRRIDLDKFSKSIDDYNVIINFEGKLIPNAKFEVDFEVKKAQTEGGEFFNFIIGDYICNAAKDCLSSEFDRYNRYFYNKKDLKTLAVYRTDKDKEGNRIDPSNEQFYLRMDKSDLINEEKDSYNQWRFLLFGSIIALIVEGLVVSFLSKEDFLEQNKEEMKQLLRLKMHQLREVVARENLNVRDNDKLELVIEIIKARNRK